MKDNTRYRFVLNVGGKLQYYSGMITHEDNQYYTIQESRLGEIQILKSNIVIRRRLEDE